MRSWDDAAPEWLWDAGECRIRILTSDGTPLVDTDLEQLSLMAKFAGEDGAWLHFSYLPRLWPEDDAEAPRPRRYFVLAVHELTEAQAVRAERFMRRAAPPT